LVVFCASGDDKKQAELEAVGVRIEKISAFEADGRPDLSAILRRLGEMEILSVMIEGGATVNGAALAAGVVDKVFLYYAPKILAGTGSVSFAAGPGFRQLSQAAQVKRVHLHRFGEDFAVEGYIRDPYAE
jgi:diaminohydroxyphosphoribosylaminopyrimidine deaminase/5-amino-6-(5-phosphoribosylamino)uracil reductase